MTNRTISKLKRHAREGDITPKELSKLFNEMMNANDRAAAIVGGALLEEGVEELLVRHMRSLATSAYEALFTGSGPLATFSAKARVAHALKYLTDEQWRNVGYIREIRNAFAHSKKRIRFADPDVKAACDLLVIHSHFANQKNSCTRESAFCWP